jgi:hypothetical protein
MIARKPQHSSIFVIRRGASPAFPKGLLLEQDSRLIDVFRRECVGRIAGLQ